jgi:Ni/Co efflux regulator RcnB
MKVTKLIGSIILLITASFSYAQEQENDSKIEKKFWKEQKAYEKELSKRDEVAHKAYMQGKRDAYAEHDKHCENHNHGYYYRHHVSYYYYNDHHYERRSYRKPNRTRINVRTPSISLGIF